MRYCLAMPVWLLGLLCVFAGMAFVKASSKIAGNTRLEDQLIT